MSNDYLMALDAGTGSIRAVIFDVCGSQIACVQREWKHSEDPRYPGSMDFDWDRNWALACTCIKGALETSGIKPAQIAAVSSTCMREGIVLYDSAGKEIWACANVDARAADEVFQLKQMDAGLERELYLESGQTFALGALPGCSGSKTNSPMYTAKSPKLECSTTGSFTGFQGY